MALMQHSVTDILDLEFWDVTKSLSHIWSIINIYIYVKEFYSTTQNSRSRKIISPTPLNQCHL